MQKDKKIDVKQFIGQNLSRLAKMSIAELKVILQRLKKSTNPDDRNLIKTITEIIQRKKFDYPISANKKAAERFQRWKELHPKVQ